MDTRSECVFGAECYRRNPHHFREYKHKHLLEILKKYPSLEVPADMNIDESQLKIFAEIEAKFGQSNTKKRSRSPSTSPSPPSGPSSKKMNSDGKKVVEESSSDSRQPRPGGEKKILIERKLEAAAPYNFFLTKVKDNPATHKAQ